MTAAIDQARVLLSKASQDEALVRKIGSDTDIADELIGFHAQQAVEKAMKAVLVAADIEFPFSHDLGLLRDLCKQAGTPLPDHPPLTAVSDAFPLLWGQGGFRRWWPACRWSVVQRRRRVRRAGA